MDSVQLTVATYFASTQRNLKFDGDANSNNFLAIAMKLRRHRRRRSMPKLL